MYITLGSLFDGIGGFPLAAIHCGIKPIWASETETFPIAVTKLRFPEMRHVGDITQLRGADLLPVDVLTGGSPCQDLSVAGRRAGIDGARSGLFHHQVRLTKELREEDVHRGRTAHLIRPRYFIWENVPGAFSSAGGQDFRTVLESICQIAEDGLSVPGPPAGGWKSAGAILGNQFSLAWRCLDAQYWGVAQRRKRIFLVADFGGLTAPEILFEQDCLSGNPAAGTLQRQRIAFTVEGCFAGTDRPIAFAVSQRNEVRNLNNRAGALAAQPGIKQQTYVADSHCLNGWDTQQSRIFVPDGTAPTMAGADGGGGRNPGGLLLTAGFCAGAGSKAGSISFHSECSPTLKAAEGGNMVPTVLCLNDQGGHHMDLSINVTGTLRAQNKSHLPLVSGPSEYPTECLKQNKNDLVTAAQSARQHKDTADIVLEVSGLDCCIAVENGEVCGTLQSHGSGGPSLNKIHPVRIGQQIRRLTPLECERLQGFPDHWTDIRKASDTSRYKALGNSVAVPCVDFVLRGIAYFLNLEEEYRE